MVKHKALYFFITLAQKEKLTPFAGIEKKREKGKPLSTSYGIIPH